MFFRSLSSWFLLLHFQTIFCPYVLAASAAAGKINLYNDYNCNHPSTLNPAVTLPLSTCLATTGGEGVVVAELPPCPQGTASLLYYQDASCGVPYGFTIPTALGAPNCFQLADGPTLINVHAVMFSCQPASNNPQPSSTSTVVVSALAAVATGSTDSSGGGSSTSAATTPTDTSTPKTGTSSSAGNSNGGASTSTGSSTSTGTSTGTGTGTGTGPGTGTSTDTGTSSHSGLTTSDIIALAVGLGVGISTIVVMLAVWLFPDFRHKLRSWLSAILNRLAFPRSEPQPQYYNHTQEMYPHQQPFRPYQR